MGRGALALACGLNEAHQHNGGVLTRKADDRGHAGAQHGASARRRGQYRSGHSGRTAQALGESLGVGVGAQSGFVEIEDLRGLIDHRHGTPLARPLHDRVEPGDVPRAHALGRQHAGIDHAG